MNLELRTDPILLLPRLISVVPLNPYTALWQSPSLLTALSSSDPPWMNLELRTDPILLLPRLSHPYLIPEQPGSSIVEHNIDCFTGCLQLEHSSSAAAQSTIKDNLNTTMDFTCMDGGNLVKMVNPPDKEIEILEDRENHNQLNDTTPKKRSNDGSVPCEVMKFTSLEEFEKYYYAYAFSEGFTVRVKKTLKFDQTNIVRYRQYVCSCAGFCDENRNQMMRLMRMKKGKGEKP